MSCEIFRTVGFEPTPLVRYILLFFGNLLMNQTLIQFFDRLIVDSYTIPNVQIMI